MYERAVMSASWRNICLPMQSGLVKQSLEEFMSRFGKEPDDDDEEISVVWEWADDWSWSILETAFADFGILEDRPKFNGEQSNIYIGDYIFVLNMKNVKNNVPRLFDIYHVVEYVEHQELIN